MQAPKRTKTAQERTKKTPPNRGGARPLKKRPLHTNCTSTSRHDPPAATKRHTARPRKGNTRRQPEESRTTAPHSQSSRGPRATAATSPPTGREHTTRADTARERHPEPTPDASHTTHQRHRPADQTSRDRPHTNWRQRNAHAARNRPQSRGRHARTRTRADGKAPGTAATKDSDPRTTHHGNNRRKNGGDGKTRAAQADNSGRSQARGNSRRESNSRGRGTNKRHTNWRAQKRQPEDKKRKKAQKAKTAADKGRTGRDKKATTPPTPRTNPFSWAGAPVCSVAIQATNTEQTGRTTRGGAPGGGRKIAFFAPAENGLVTK